MLDNINKYKEGEPKAPLSRVFPSLASPSAQDLSLPHGHFFRRVNRLKKWRNEKVLEGEPRNQENGFTITELVVTLVVFGIIITTLGSVFFNYMAAITRTNVSVEMTNDSQVLLRTIAEELRYGAGVRQTNTITDANAPTGGWNTSVSNFVIITAVPALDHSRNYIIDSSTGSPYINELVYYKDGSKLLKRVLAHPDAFDNSLTTTCPPASATTSCPADRTLVENLSNMVFTLYDQDNVVTANAVEARSVKIDLTLSRKSLSKTLTITNSIRTTLRNTF